MGKILDISHHQVPSAINYDELAKHVDLVIIRTQYGSKTIDKHYLTHHAEFRKRGIPTQAYAWVRGVSIQDMQVEAMDFYKRTKDLNPEVWWLDVEEQSMADMRGGVSAYVKALRSCGVKKIGIYIANHLYKSFNLNLSEVDAVWIPHYGKNNGELNSKPVYPCDIHQYTSVGKLPGYKGNLDLNVLTGSKSLDWFTGNEAKTMPQSNEGIGILTILDSTVLRKDAVYTAEIIKGLKPGEAYIVHDFKDGWYNVGGWVAKEHVRFVPRNNVKMTK